MIRAARLLPGIVLCACMAALAVVCEHIEQSLAGQAYLEAMVLAILIGLLLRMFWEPGVFWLPGILFSAKILLEIAVVLLGAAVSARTVFALGPKLLAGITAVVPVSLGASYLICRTLRLRPRLALLIACGNSICGNSAIAAVAPVIGGGAH